jgi:hypothetical protein
LREHLAVRKKSARPGGALVPRLVRVWPHEPPTLRPLLLITHEDLRRSTRIRVVSSAVAEAFKREARVLRYGSAAVQTER